MMQQQSETQVARRRKRDCLTLPAELTFGVAIMEIILSMLWTCYGGIVLEQAAHQIFDKDSYGMWTVIVFFACYKMSKGFIVMDHYTNADSRVRPTPQFHKGMVVFFTCALFVFTLIPAFTQSLYIEYTLYGVIGGCASGIISIHTKHYIKHFYNDYPDKLHHFLEYFARSISIIVTACVLPFIFVNVSLKVGRIVLSCLVLLNIPLIYIICCRKDRCWVIRNQEEAIEMRRLRPAVPSTITESPSTVTTRTQQETVERSQSTPEEPKTSTSEDSLLTTTTGTHQETSDISSLTPSESKPSTSDISSLTPSESKPSTSGNLPVTVATLTHQEIVEINQSTITEPRSPSRDSPSTMIIETHQETLDTNRSAPANVNIEPMPSTSRDSILSVTTETQGTSSQSLGISLRASDHTIPTTSTEPTSPEKNQPIETLNPLGYVFPYFASIIIGVALTLLLIMFSSIPLIEFRNSEKQDDAARKRAMNVMVIIGTVWCFISGSLFISSRLATSKSVRDLVAGNVALGISFYSYHNRHFLLMPLVLFAAGSIVTMYHKQHFYFVQLKEEHFNEFKGYAEFATGIVMILFCTILTLTSFSDPIPGVIKNGPWIFFTIAIVIGIWDLTPKVRKLFKHLRNLRNVEIENENPIAQPVEMQNVNEPASPNTPEEMPV